MTIDDMRLSRLAYMETLPSLPIEAWDAMSAAYAAGWTAATKLCTEEMGNTELTGAKGVTPQ
jgi:hypothetical protein